MSPKGIIEKKKGKSPIVPLEKFYQIAFLDRPLPKIISILHYMQLKREEQNDKEGYMYYTPIVEHPFDTLSKKQIDVFGYTFSIESNADALLKNKPLNSQQISPISTGRHIRMPPKNMINHKTVDSQTVDSQTVDSQTLDSQPYSKPIGPLSFLGTTVPQAPEPTFVNFLQACSK
jgi:hypothetical protein